MKHRTTLVFAALSALVMLGVFRDAIWGGSLLAPLDLAPAFFAKYRFVDPQIRVPANHYSIDQLTQDLPVQHTIYEALHRGEMPWWDPYTYCGRPLLADAHINGTDFVRVTMYALLPFELAYNWTRLAHFFLGGLGMLLLLRHLGFRDWIVVPLALAYEFGGCHTLYFQHPWIQASFVYYPFLWLAWDAAGRSQRGWLTVLAALLVAAVFYAGSVQTHTYLVLFALAYGWGTAGRDPAQWKRILPVMVVSGLIGACLAAPVLLGQVELFRLSRREVHVAGPLLGSLSGVVSLSGSFFPWSLGTFRTLDLGKFLGQTGLGFNIFIGSAATVLAVAGIFARPATPERRAVRRIALVLTGGYVLILSTPLLNIFYARIGALAAMGLTVLAAAGVEFLWQSSTRYARAGWWLAGVTAAFVLAINLAALLIYPQLVPKVKAFVNARANTATLDEAPALRDFQVENLPREVSLLNPETVLAWLSLAGVAIFLLRPQLRGQPAAWVVLLGLNLLPVVLFCGRYVPRQPMVLWQRLQEGGPEQHRVAATLADSPGRLWEFAPGVHEMLFPMTFGNLYRVRTVHGYTSLAPHCLGTLPAEEAARYAAQAGDWIYESKGRGRGSGDFRTNATPGWARFQWQGPSPRAMTVEEQGLNTIRLRLDPGAAGKILWSDSYYPGWQAATENGPARLVRAAPCFSLIQIPAGARTLVLHYEPRFLRLGLGCAAAGLLVATLLVVVPGYRRK